MLNNSEIDAETIARKQQKIIEITLYRFLFGGDFFCLSDLETATTINKKELIDRYVKNDAQRQLFAAISEQKLTDLSSVLDEHSRDPEVFNFNDFITFNFSVLLHLWLSYFPQQSGALALVKRLTMSDRERKLCLDVISGDIAELHAVLEEAAPFSEEFDLKLFNPFVYAELKRLDKIFSIIEGEGSIDELERLLDHPVGGGISLNAARRMEPVLRWAHHFKNGPVLQFLNTKYKLIENARDRRDNKLIAFYLACGIQEESRWSLVESLSLATTDFFAHSVSAVSQYVRSFWESEEMPPAKDQKTP